MAAGPKRTVISIEQATLVPDDSGQLAATWSTYATRWAEVMPVSGKETFENRQTQAEVTWKVTLRSDPLTRAITPAMRVVIGERPLNVSRVYDPDNRRATIEIECTEPVTP